MRGPGRRATTLLPAAVCALAGGCSQGGLAPQGPAARQIATILWALTITGGVVAVAVLLAWGWGVGRGRGAPAASTGEHAVEGAVEGADTAHDAVAESRLVRRFVIGGGVALPAVVVAGFFVVQVASSASPLAGGALTVEVTGHRYWWEVTYPDAAGADAFTTANEVRVPTGTPVTVVLRSEDVIHSFWVPQLAGKVDLVPGVERRLTFAADEPGTYAGFCAEYCGLQHTWMKFQVVALEPAAYEQWAAQEARPAAPPADELRAAGQDVFTTNSCVGCHTIRGVSDAGTAGPDLTHLASRDQIGAGVLPLTAANLAGWISNPQDSKPGAGMPPQSLSDAEIEALVAYLMSLE